MSPCTCCNAPTERHPARCYTCRRHKVPCSTEMALPPGRWVPTPGGVLVYRLSEDGGALPRRPEFCGTERGYQWHRANDPFNWPLPADDPCGCRAAHRGHYHFLKSMKERERYRKQREQEVA